MFIIDSGLKIYQVMTPRMGKHCIKYLRWHKMLFMIDLHENIFFFLSENFPLLLSAKIIFKKVHRIIISFPWFSVEWYV